MSGFYKIGKRAFNYKTTSYFCDKQDPYVNSRQPH